MRIEFNVRLEINGKDLLTRTSWSRIRKQIKHRDGMVCQYCGCVARDGGVDHVAPLSKGGTDAPNNLVWCCRSCNSSKNNKTMDEWVPDLSQYAPAPVQPIVEVEPGLVGKPPVPPPDEAVTALVNFYNENGEFPSKRSVQRHIAELEGNSIASMHRATRAMELAQEQLEVQ